MGGGLAESFMRAARQAIEAGEPIRFPAETILKIAADPVEVVRFRTLARQINNDELRDFLLTYLQDMRRGETRRGRTAERWANGVKLGVGGVGTTTIVTGLVSILATGGAAAPIFAIICGAGGLAVGVGGSTYFQLRKDRSSNAVEDIDILIEALRR